VADAQGLASREAKENIEHPNGGHRRARLDGTRLGQGTTSPDKAPVLGNADSDGQLCWIAVAAHLARALLPPP
jgi:hypothetical protein